MWSWAPYYLEIILDDVKIMGRFTDHTVRRVECKRTVDEISDFRLSYNFNITKKEIENKVFNIEYTFTIEYKEDVGLVVVEGALSYKDTPKALKDLSKNWDENTVFQQRLFNLIFRNAVTMVMDLSRHLDLPAPIFFPEIRPDQLE